MKSEPVESSPNVTSAHASARANAEAPVLLLSTYELGHAPLGTGWIGGFLEHADIAFQSADLSVETISVDQVRAAKLIVFSVPMHTAMRLALVVLNRVRELVPRTPVAFVGHYAALHRVMLKQNGVDHVLAGEFESTLVELLSSGSRLDTSATNTNTSDDIIPLRRQRMPLPVRGPRAKLESYSRYIDADGDSHLAGYAETTRGCKEHCRHCPIPSVYNGRFVAVDAETVIDDIAGQVTAGAAHITFGDPDFLNGPTHSLRICREVHRRWPELTFDFTAQVANLLNHRAAADELVNLGCSFIVSAVESLSDVVLARLAKRHRAADVESVLRWSRSVNVELRPTLVPFTPWTTLEDITALTEWVSENELEANVAPVQLGIRLLVPPGSGVLADDHDDEYFGPYDPEELGHVWTHRDPRVDALAATIAELTSVGADADESVQSLHSSIDRAAHAARGFKLSDSGPRRMRRVPRVSEPWFC